MYSRHICRNERGLAASTVGSRNLQFCAIGSDPCTLKARKSNSGRCQIICIAGSEFMCFCGSTFAAGRALQR